MHTLMPRRRGHVAGVGATALVARQCVRMAYVSTPVACGMDDDSVLACRHAVWACRYCHSCFSMGITLTVRTLIYMNAAAPLYHHDTIIIHICSRHTFDDERFRRSFNYLA